MKSTMIENTEHLEERGGQRQSSTVRLSPGDVVVNPIAQQFSIPEQEIKDCLLGTLNFIERENTQGKWGASAIARYVRIELTAMVKSHGGPGGKVTVSAVRDEDMYSCTCEYKVDVTLPVKTGQYASLVGVIKVPR